VGAALFPFSLTVCALLYWPVNPLIYQGAALILALADGLAGLIGQQLGQRAYQITGHKTIEGSFIFFLITVSILLGLHLFQQNDFGPVQILGSVTAALSLTAVEGLVGKGWDNLPVSLLGGLAAYLLL